MTSPTSDDPVERTGTSPISPPRLEGDPIATLPPDAIPNYKLLGEIHRGGQGVVYRALQLSTHRVVAIKVMKEGPFGGAEERARFEREVRILAQLRHPHIVTVHDTGVAAGCHYIVMDHIEGVPLGEWMKRHALSRVAGGGPAAPLSEVLALFANICDALSVAHGRGIVHRDLKPGNILVDEAGQPHVVDFGIAKLTAQATAEDVTTPAVTVSGQFLGSLPWSSPEQAEGRASAIDARSDVYSLGVILYQWLAGRFPYDVSGPMHQVMERILHAPPAPLKRTSTGRLGDVETIVLKCLAKESSRRYANAAEMAADIRHCLAGEPIEARRDSLAYRVGTRGRGLLRRFRIGSLVGGVVAATLAAHFVGEPLVYRWTRINQAYMRFMSSNFLSTRFGPTLDHVRVIAITDATDVEKLARRAGIDGVTEADWKSVRRLHGRLFEKLAGAGVRALTSDIGFRGETEFDGDLLRGVRALRAAGIETTVVGGMWWLDAGGAPDISKTLLGEVRWGSSNAGFGSEVAWRLELVMQRGLAEPLPSLGVATIAASRRPEAQFSLLLDAESEGLDVLYWTWHPLAPRTRQFLNDSDHIKLGFVVDLQKDFPAQGLRAGDTIGYFVMDIPPDDVLERSTVEYAKAFEATEEQLRAWFRDKVVVLGDLRQGKDRFKHPDGRMVAGCHGHATGIDALFRRVGYDRPRLAGVWILIALGAVLGCVVSGLQTGRPARRYGALVLLTGIALGASIVAFRQFQYLYAPFVPIVAMWLAGLWTTGVNRARASVVRPGP